YARRLLSRLFFCFNATPSTELYTLSLHDALPIFPAPPSPGGYVRAPHPASGGTRPRRAGGPIASGARLAVRHPERCADPPRGIRDRKSTRLNSSHLGISYAVFCLKKKKLRLEDKT